MVFSLALAQLNKINYLVILTTNILQYEFLTQFNHNDSKLFSHGMKVLKIDEKKTKKSHFCLNDSFYR